VIIYLASGDDVKASRSEAILADGGVISVQVLNETANIARRKMGLSWPETHDLLATLRELVSVIPLSVSIHEAGLALATRHNFPIYDAMIVAAALEADCDMLFTEDMHAGMRIDDRLTIVNPFLGD
jgi:predicted nucleic acid-binding protein